MFCHTHGIRSDIQRLSANQHSGLEPPSLKYLLKILGNVYITTFQTDLLFTTFLQGPLYISVGNWQIWRGTMRTVSISNERGVKKIEVLMNFPAQEQQIIHSDPGSVKMQES